MGKLNSFEGYIEKALNIGVKTILAVITVIIGIQVVKFLRQLLIKTLRKANIDTGVIQFLDSLFKVVLYFFLILIVLSLYGFHATSIVAIIGSLGLTIGLALQGSLSNFVGGVIILLSKPFVVGDYILEKSKDTEGTVKEIKLFYTKLNTYDNKEVILPNGNLANSPIINYTASKERMYEFKLSIAHTADIRRARDVIQSVLNADEEILHDLDINIYVDSLDASYTILGVRCWLETSKFVSCKWRICENVKYALYGASIEIAPQKIDITLNS